MKKKQLNDTHKAGNLDIKMTNDLLFKYLLQKNSNVLKSIICSLLYMDESEVVDTVVTNPILLGEAITDKNVVLDVNVLMNDNTHIDLEMQVIDYKDWPERSLIYGLRNLDDLEEGEEYLQIKPSIQLAFLDYQPFKGYDRFYSVNRLMDIEDHHLYTDKLTIGFVDLTNIDLATENDKKYRLDKWNSKSNSHLSNRKSY